MQNHLPLKILPSTVAALLWDGTIIIIAIVTVGMCNPPLIDSLTSKQTSAIQYIWGDPLFVVIVLTWIAWNKIQKIINQLLKTLVIKKLIENPCK